MDRVERRLTAARHDSERPEPVAALYDPTDPYAVTFRFRNGIEWTFARDLIAHGLHEPAGDRTHGDVLVLPCGGVVEIALSSPCGHVALTFQAAALEAFLDATTALVPLGAERIDWDRAMRTLGGAR